MTDATVYGLVLAGGKSRRMGQDKARLVRDGQSQLEYAVSVVSRCVSKVFVSARADQQSDEERSRFELIIDRMEDLGPVAGILSAMEAHPGVDWLVVACDLPNIDEAALRSLLQAVAGDQPFIAYESSYDGLPEPLCAVYRAGSADIVRRFVADGTNCPRKILIRSDTRLLQQANPSVLDNVNTPDDLDNSVLRGST